VEKVTPAPIPGPNWLSTPVRATVRWVELPAKAAVAAAPEEMMSTTAASARVERTGSMFSLSLLIKVQKLLWRK
jgi:hypothetical protein